MSSVSRFSWLAASMIVVAVLVCGLATTGCGPATTSGDQAEPETVAQPDPEPVVQPESQPAAEPEVEPEAEPESKIETTPEPEPEPEPEPVVETDPEPAVDAGEVQISSFAPAADLVGQVDYYIERLVDSVASEEEYGESQDKIAKDSNTIIVLALVLGLHDEDNQYKAAAPGLLKAAQDLAASSDYASASKAVAAVNAAATATPAGGVLKWEKVASLPELMKQVPLVNTKLKRYVKRNRAKESAAYSALIAAIAHATTENAEDTDVPDETEKWKAFCIQMRQAAGAVNASVHAGDKEAIAAGMEDLAKSCDDCHAVFHPEEADGDQ